MLVVPIPSFMSQSGGGGGGGPPSVTWDSANIGSAMTLSGSNTIVSKTTSGWQNASATASNSTGKMYVELKITGNASYNQLAISPIEPHGGDISGSTSSLSWDARGSLANVGYTNNTTSVPTLTTGDTVSFAVDFDAGKVWLGKNGVYTSVLAGSNPSTGTNPALTFTPPLTLYPTAVLYSGGSTVSVQINGSSGTFAYSLPTGFSAWG